MVQLVIKVLDPNFGTPFIYVKLRVARGQRPHSNLSSIRHRARERTVNNIFDT